ncbi:MAG: hydantoinase/oxoprolinase family protein [Alicyclobacillus sp.]|nr:hydantoinase/oxoprolinase family protein [Alicyclobacillus sp.]
MSEYRIGIDVGGTNTDAVILDADNQVIAEVKTATTEDVTTGIERALGSVLDLAKIDRSEVKYAMLGTTHCTNAIVERKRLNRVGIIRIGAPATLAVEPLTGIPEDLTASFSHHVLTVEGGHEFDGREIVPLDEKSIYAFAEALKGKIDAAAVTSVFSPVSRTHEERAEAILKEVLGEQFPVSLSHKIGSIGLLERENATILNAALIGVAVRTVRGFEEALRKEGVCAQIFFGQNDGTLMSKDYAVQYPIFMIACGPTNSLRGASSLTGLENAIIVDVGGTTTDIGVIAKGFPRESAVAVEIGGVRTNFRMPDLVSVGIGGGTVIRIHEDGSFTIGPNSVGYQLTEKALVFGGDTLTFTDVAVALGRAEIGDRTRVEHLDKALLESIYQAAVEKIEGAIDRMKVSSASVPVVLTGGGSILLPDDLKGASHVVRPAHYNVANAIGAAIAQVSGEIERVYSLEKTARKDALEDAKRQALENAIRAGARPETCQIVDVEDIPLAYLPGNATRIKVKAAGDLAPV